MIYGKALYKLLEGQPEKSNNEIFEYLTSYLKTLLKKKKQLAINEEIFLKAEEE